MADFLTTQGTAYHLENIIMNADQWLILISPYLSITQSFLRRLQDADKRKVRICIVYGKDELRPEEKMKLRKLENLSLRYCKNLHAKCFLNENSMIITSMNMYEFSEKTNREMGVLIHKDSDTDHKIYEDAVREVKSILESAKEAGTNVNSQTSKTGSLGKTGEFPIGLLNAISGKYDATYGSSQGYCIRCGREIPYDLYKPYCRECFSAWRDWENPFYIEKYCHSCGKGDRSSMLYPRCHSCFQKSQ